jgi:PAS domain S-box-containing protein
VVLAALTLLAVCAIAWLAGSMQLARDRADASSAEAAARAQALERSEERYRSFIQRSSEGIWRIEVATPVPVDLPEDEQIARFYRDAILAECNDAMARMYGFREARELTGKRLEELLVPQDPANREYLLAFIRSGYRLIDGESHERGRQGEDKYFLNNLVGTIEHGCVVRAWGTQRDVSASRRTESALRVSEERLRLALGAGEMGIWDWDMTTGAIQWSENLEPLHGLAPGTFAGTFEAFLALIHPDDRQRFTDVVRDAVERRGDYEAEFRVVSPDGTLRWMLGKGQVFADASNRPVRLIGVAIDVTARKFVEEELRDSVARLEETERDVQQLFVREREARDEAERSNRAKDEFLATLSHELRSPLSAALSWAHLLRTGQLDAEKTARAVETIERTTRLQVRLIEDLLDISRIVSGKLTVERGVVDLGSVIEAAIETVRSAAEARGLELRVFAPAELLLVGGDGARLEQVVGNLLGNALKFTPKGGVVTVAWRREGGHAEIRVADTGVGIPPDVLPHVFDRFRQADSSTTRRHGGLGLGLAIVRHLVELHGGTIAAESRGEGQGATFRVELPLHIPAELGWPTRPGRVVARAADPHALVGLQVLAVDDEADILESLETILSAAGATVATATSTTAALARFDAKHPDVVVSDLAMPERDGFALLRALRASGATVPVIALTALAGAADRQRAVAAGFDLYVTKPIDPPSLVAAVARVAAVH